MSIYDWKNVPEFIQVITTCKDGAVKGYSKPMWRGDTWCSCYTLFNIKPYQGDWRNSLEERPK